MRRHLSGQLHQDAPLRNAASLRPMYRLVAIRLPTASASGFSGIGFRQRATSFGFGDHSNLRPVCRSAVRTPTSGSRVMRLNRRTSCVSCGKSSVSNCRREVSKRAPQPLRMSRVRHLFTARCRHHARYRVNSFVNFREDNPTTEFFHLMKNES